ncbi:MAG: rhodanese-like domain-containing protein [Bacteroidota bacterium]|uniref:MBL fold metallo-hydrolase n=1 Tax=Flagellimonas profundi TaxID=2915620 RepID=A0ABS3FBB5_9FLAO|nr:rhodanese-like domain-containing protein [Allomuricauda profundi]MBO0340449.1 MBL fold metallo-hydrolase [Allomuricauda profundi]MEC7770255.1 rhodanese-like domain-containing protein [Bacteroidota bacterium]
MEIKQFEYKPLAHYSYAIVDNGEMAVIDPERDPMQYYAFAQEHEAKIVAVIETHPHADFISSHLQIHKETGASIYHSKDLGADYNYEPFDEGQHIMVGDIKVSALNTPGHSPDSITVVAEKDGKTALFTGDTLFIGDVGRPDLREKAGNMTAKRQELAEMMYHSIQNKFKDLPDGALVYPAHGAGSLCGKNLSSDNSSTLGNERMGNWAFKPQSKEEFVNTLLDSQPFIPSYFGFDVDTNRKGPENLRTSIAQVPLKLNTSINGLIVDVRDETEFKKGHLPGSINIMAVSENSKFETWLGAIINPEEPFSLVVEKPSDAERILKRVAKIGYEKQVKLVLTLDESALVQSDKLDLTHFKNNPNEYTIVDIRNQSEIEEGKYFESALTIPLNDLRSSSTQIPKNKPIIVHCAGGYRSSAGSSILESLNENVQVYDLGDNINDFK